MVRKSIEPHRKKYTFLLREKTAKTNKNNLLEGANDGEKNDNKRKIGT